MALLQIARVAHRASFAYEAFNKLVVLATYITDMYGPLNADTVRHRKLPLNQPAYMWIVLITAHRSLKCTTYVTL